MTKHRQQSTKVKVKGTDLIWSQICSSLLRDEALGVEMGSEGLEGTGLVESWVMLLISSFPKVVLEISHESCTVFGTQEQTRCSEKMKRAGVELRWCGWRGDS